MRMSGGYRGWAAKLQLADIYAAMAVGLASAACLKQGLFFSEDWYPILTIWFLLCGAAAAIRLQGGVERLSGGLGYAGRAQMMECSLAGDSERGEESKSAGKRSRVQMVMLGGPIVLAALYAVAWLRGPLSAQGTMNELLRWSGCGSFAILAWKAASGANAGRMLSAVWHAVGMLLCLSGLLSFCGALPIPYAVFQSASPEISASGARLGGLLQYPNAFGAVMAVFLLERLFAAAQRYADESGGRHGRKGKDAGSASYSREGNAPGTAHAEPFGRCVPAKGLLSGELLHLAPLFPYAAALLLSESRGAWLAAACAAAAALSLQRRLALPLLAAGAAPLAAAALLYRGLAALPAAPLPGLPLLAGLWAGALAAGLWLGRRAQHAAGRGRAAALTLAALAWTAGGAAVLMLVRARGTGPSSTVAARGLMYRDALRFAAEAPWLGRGGETWRSAYLAVQSRPYVGSQVHSGYLDLLLNVGVIGAAAAAISLAAAGWLIKTHARRLLPPFLVIVLHGAVDFDWSYGLFWLLLFWLPALARAESARAGSLSGRRTSAWRLPAKILPVERTLILIPKHMLTDHLSRFSTIERMPTDHLSSFSTLEHLPADHLSRFSSPKRMHPIPASAGHSPAGGGRRKKSLNLYPLPRRLFAAGACCLLLTLSLLSFRAYQGEALYRAAASARQPQEALALLERSLAWNPLSPKSVVALASFYEPKRKKEILMSGLHYSPMNPTLNWAMAEAVSEEGPPGEALYWLRRSQQLDVFNYVKRTEAVRRMLTMGERYLAEGDGGEALRCAEAGRELLRQYFLLAAGTAETTWHNDRNFRFTAEARSLHERVEALRREASGLRGQRRVAEAYAFKRR
ncbi:O-Antigen ligase [Paenibacillus sophorae]|uniref:O-Antigen ligase n=1 Tax=Paenibacillus sophorae TaxID=1333845 RepID=A0A1H8SMN4_9BACL|nr:O-antigen ligase family protein [Paenibacillus sophorae]QWU15489.1 O-antigen ligase family protein [Paenibacillus sophorae]SEO79952.1 O-Antigen ligase [Paenibacillus sophorae]